MEWTDVNPEQNGNESPMDEGHSAVLDPQIVSQLYDEIGEDAREIFKLYLDQLDERVEGIKVEINRDDNRRLGEMAHRLRGSSHNVGATQMADLCLSLEHLARGEINGNATEVLFRLTEAANHLKTSLIRQIERFDEEPAAEWWI